MLILPEPSLPITFYLCTRTCNVIHVGAETRKYRAKIRCSPATMRQTLFKVRKIKINKKDFTARSFHFFGEKKGGGLVAVALDANYCLI